MMKAFLVVALVVSSLVPSLEVAGFFLWTTTSCPPPGRRGQTPLPPLLSSPGGDWQSESLTNLMQWMARGGPTTPTVPSRDFDIVVIGAGPVGVRAAIRGAELGCKVLLADGSPSSDVSFGGPTGLFSKALRDTAKKVTVVAYRSLGMDDESIWTQVRNDCVRLASTNAQARRRELATAGASLARGGATFTRFLDSGLDVKVGDVTYRCKYALVATGSSAFKPANIPFDGRRVFDSDTINSLSYLPRSIAITGSGIVAIEYAKIFRKLGAEVSLIFRDSSPKKALEKTGVDKDLASTLISDLRRSGVTLEKAAVCSAFAVPTEKAPLGSSTSLKRLPLQITLSPSGKTGALEDDSSSSKKQRTLKVDAYLAAVGRRPNTASLNLEKIGCTLDEFGNVVVDSNLRTTCPRVFAAGDVVGRPFLASTGVAQGLRAVEGAAKCVADDGECAPYREDLEAKIGASFDPASLASDPFAFPVGIWTSPEVSWFGLSLAQAKARGIDAIEGIGLYREILRGVVFSPEGLLKLVADAKTHEIIGVHIAGDDACEIIHYGMELVRAKRTLEDVIAATYSAVTFHELYQVAAAACLDPQAARIRRRAAGAASAASMRESKSDEALWKTTT
mmetsp:Transcript_9507/g.31050  ORF Transcript_9507/g.31050 Transcript_9507/m.31050 type:complete len:620 (+) Transcript_9507:27-1886(+)